MNNKTGALLVVFFLVVMAGIGGAVFTVDETQQVVLTQFGELVGQRPITAAGLYFKLPFVQTANYFDKRILDWDGDADQIPTREKRLIWVDTTARWRIADALKYMQRIRTEPSAQTRLDDIIDAKTREVISSHMLIEVIRNSNRLIEQGETESLGQVSAEFGATALEPITKGRKELSLIILNRAAEAVRDYGIELVDVKITRINYVTEVQQKVYERMISERKRAAEQFRSEGQGKKAEIEGQMAKELEEIRSQAYRKAQEIKGKADAEAIKIYADAYKNDPEFYSFLKALETYRKTITEDTTLMLTTENDLYEYLRGFNDNSQIQ
ncbi:MAG: HflC protein [Omnitrophica WOR_2 bacterium RIFCSPHIGHO2_02_FULL_52_10]|nr:MAG: HflC protein [Omnitrophica WOR_2 bacterium RIFCSPHIGHO2_02_FULL_52_10]